MVRNHVRRWCVLAMATGASLVARADIPPDPLTAQVEWAGSTIPFGTIFWFVLLPIGLSVLLLRTLRAWERQRAGRCDGTDAVADRRIWRFIILTLVGFSVAWAFLLPLRIRGARELLGRRFDERLDKTVYSTVGILGYRGKALSRSVMRQAVSDDWQLQLMCGDVPVDWLLDEVDDLEGRVLRGGRCETPEELLMSQRGLRRGAETVDAGKRFPTASCDNEKGAGL